MCLLLRSEILGLLANKLTVADKYSRNYREIFLRPIQKLLSEKPKLSSEFFITSLKSQPVITTRIYVLHKITIALKFMFYINSDLPIPAKKLQTPG